MQNNMKGAHVCLNMLGLYRFFADISLSQLLKLTDVAVLGAIASMDGNLQFTSLLAVCQLWQDDVASNTICDDKICSMLRKMYNSVET